jgi:hypothetical protein
MERAERGTMTDGHNLAEPPDVAKYVRYWPVGVIDVAVGS